MMFHTNKRFRQAISVLLCAVMVLSILLVAPAEEMTASAASYTPAHAAGILSKYAYSGGAGSTLLTYDCGNGITNNGTQSCIRIIRNTTVSEFNAYCSLLAADHTLTYAKDIASNESTRNLFRKYAASDGSYSFYVYYLPDYDETRIIVDTNRDTVEGFQYTEQTGATVSPKMVMWGLSTAGTGYHYETTTPYSTGQKNNGALTIVRMRDNSLFIHDGGHLTQMNDEAADELLALCRELTGLSGTDKKITISGWALSHAHDDHFMGFGRFLNKYHQYFDVKNIIYNIDIERTDWTRDIHDVMTNAAKYFPGVRYYKPHTGESFTVAGVTFDVMYTHEDAMYPNSSNQLKINDSDKGSTYRSCMYTSGTTSDFNDTSTVLRLTFSNGVDSIWYGDMNLGENVVREIYPASAFVADIVTVPHHGFDSHPYLMQVSNAKIFLYTQNKQCIYGTDDDVTTIDLYGTARSDLAATSTDMKRNFVAMFPEMNVAKGVEPSGFYQIYWGGNETAIIDINAVAGAYNRATIRSCVQTRKALSYPYTGWSIDSLTDEPEFRGVVSVENPWTSGYTSSTTPHAWLVKAAEPLTQYSFYALMSNKYGYIMSYDPVKTMAGPNPARSIPLDEDGDSLGTYSYVGDNIIFDPGSRNDAIWVMGQYAVASGGKEKPSGATMAANAAINFNGGAIYQGIQLWKGVQGTHGSYWDSTGSTSDYRFLDYSKNGVTYSASCWKTALPAASTQYILESFGNDTYVLYYKAGDRDFRFLCCDQYGNWGIRRYADGVSGCRPYSQIRADLEDLKIRVFYYRYNGNKSLAVKGPKTFNVNSTATSSSVLAAVDHYVTVFDPSAQNLHIPSSGTSAKAAHYRVAFASTFRPNVEGTYQVNVIYRNDDGTDTLVGTVDVVVANHTWTEATCTTPSTCKHCGQTRGSALGHDFRDYLCTRCGQVETITVYFDASVKGWSNVNAHYWNSSGNTTAWPGKAMTHIGNNVYSLKIPGNMPGIIFNNGTYQTDDLSVPSDGYIHDGYQWVPYGDTFSTVFYVSGSGTALGNWDADFPAGKMSNQGDGNFSVTFKNVPAGSYEYKVTSGNWNVSWGKGEGNFTFNLKAQSDVTVTFNVNTNVASVNVECKHNYKAQVVAPTCTTGGYTVYTCTCGSRYTDNETPAAGHSYTEKITKPATCTAKGEKTFTCSGCGDSYTEALTALGHSYTSQVVAPTCTEAGYTQYTCTTCGDHYRENGAASTGHHYEKEVTTPAGCTTEGLETYTCTLCSDAYTAVIPVIGHGYLAKVVPPTCTQDGYTQYTCENCGDHYKTKPVAALGHSYSVKVTTAPGCDSGGTKIYTCTTCGHTYSEALAATGHNYQVTVVAPTCTETGYTLHACPCGYEYRTDEVPAKGHSFKTVVTAPTCLEGGYTTYTCQVCDHSEIGDKTPASGHKERTVSGYAATCTQEGLTDGKVCGVCGTTILEQKAIPAKGHQYTTERIEPDCTADGKQIDTCQGCGDTIVTKIPSLGHSYQVKVTAPTCTEEGYTTHTCATCGDSYVDSHLPATGHNYDNYVCTGCGDVIYITVYFDNSVKSWKNIHAHYWNNKGDTTVWPGETMTKVGDNLYMISVPGNMPDIIFNNGTYQTKDLTIPGDGYAYDGYNWAFLGREFATAFYVTGSGDALGQWDADFPAGKMNNLGNGTFGVTFQRVPAGTHEYKVTNGTWDQSWGNGEGNFSFHVMASSNVTIIFDVNTNTTKVSVKCLHDYRSQVVAPTCTQGGYTLHSCVCGSSYKDNETDAAGHSYLPQVVKAATCTDTGITVHTCAVCSDVYEETTQATGHHYEETVLHPTCTEGGYTTYACSGCDDFYMDLWVDPLGHSYDEGVITTAPGCKTTGIKTFTCVSCGFTKTKTLAALGHHYDAVVTAPTCTEPGFTTHTCAGCGDSYVDSHTKALGHSYDEGQITIIPGCDTDGITTYTCTLCGDTKTERAEATKHQYVSVVTPPTCTEAGYTTHTCEKCGGSYVDSRKAALGHRYDAGWIVKQPDCENEGQKLLSCQECGEEQMEILAATGHSYQEKVTAPTCTKLGFTDHICANCGNTYTDSYVPAVGHSYGKGETTLEPNCDTEGQKTFICGICGDVKLETIPANGHRYQSQVVAPGCTQQGYAEHTCLVCGDSYQDGFVPALGHSYDSGVTTTHPDCENQGVKTYTCAGCGDVQTELIPALGHNYRDGVCTRCHGNDPDYAEPGNRPVIDLRYPTVSFKDEIMMNIYFAGTNMENVAEAGLILYSTQVSTWNIHNAETLVSGYRYVESSGLYSVTTNGIPAKNLGDTLWFAVYTKLDDGRCYYSDLVDYSPRRYAYSLLGSGSAELDNLLISMLNYGAAAQLYFGYRTDDLVNADLTQEQKALVESYRSDMMSKVEVPDVAKQGEFVSNGGFVDRYPSVTFGGAFSINYYYIPSFVPVDGITMYYWKEGDYRDAEVLTPENATGMTKITHADNGIYRGAVTGLAAKNIDDGVYAAFVYSDGTTTYTSGVLPYSIGTYCNDMAKDSNGFEALAQATVVYGYSAREYFNK